MVKQAVSLQSQCGRLIETQGRVPEADRLHQLFEFCWECKMRENPEWATQLGHPGYDGQWTDWSFEAVEARRKSIDIQLKALESISKEHLNVEDRLSCELFRWTLEDV